MDKLRIARPVLYVNPEDFDDESRARRLAEQQPVERLDSIAARVLRDLRTAAPRCAAARHRRNGTVPAMRRHPYSQGLRRGGRRKAVAPHLDRPRAIVSSDHQHLSGDVAPQATISPQPRLRVAGIGGRR